MQQFQSLRLQLNAQRGHAGEIDARSAQASDEPESDRINAGDEVGMVVVAALAANTPRT